MGRESHNNNNHSTVARHSSIALLQERFRQLQRVKEMRQERELRKLMLTTESINNNKHLFISPIHNNHNYVSAAATTSSRTRSSSSRSSSPSPPPHVSLSLWPTTTTSQEEEDQDHRRRSFQKNYTSHAEPWKNNNNNNNNNDDLYDWDSCASGDSGVDTSLHL
ncbi:hypothetical protein HN51_065111 [Arachis hypogaea]|nr:uncharacterized protein DS421_14g452830 [Arachis hypogaea]